MTGAGRDVEASEEADGRGPSPAAMQAGAEESSGAEAGGDTARYAVGVGARGLGLGRSRDTGAVPGRGEVSGADTADAAGASDAGVVREGMSRVSRSSALVSAAIA